VIEFRVKWKERPSGLLRALDRLIERITRRHERVAREAVMAFIRAARATAPKRTGALAKSIQLGSVSHTPEGLRFRVTMAPYGRFTLEGTRPHVIFPKRARALAFRWENAPEEALQRLHFGRSGVVFLPKVLHPGTKGRRWDLEAWEKVRPQVEGQLKGEVALYFPR